MSLVTRKPAAGRVQTSSRKCPLCVSVGSRFGDNVVGKAGNHFSSIASKLTLNLTFNK